MEQDLDMQNNNNNDSDIIKGHEVKISTPQHGFVRVG